MKLMTSILLSLFVSCTVPGEAGHAQAPASEVAHSGHGNDFSLDKGGLADGERSSRPASSPLPTEDLAPDAPMLQRHVIYSAALRLVVASVRETHVSILALAREFGGHLQESNALSVTVRVPAANFEAALARIQLLGEVVDSNVRAADVTEEMLDLDIRLGNARRARERLLEHLAKSEKLEDTLKIERELTRVTGEIERLEGRQRYLQSQIAMSTIRVDLDANAPQSSGDEFDLPFDWIGRLGDGLIAGTVQGRPRRPSFLARGPHFDPPADFVRYYSSKELVEAMHAEGLRIKVQKHDNFDEGALAFWRALARTALVERRALALNEERSLEADRALLVGAREVGNQSLGYLLVIVRSRRSIHTFEAWGPKEIFDRAKASLIESSQSLRP